MSVADPQQSEIEVTMVRWSGWMCSHTCQSGVMLPKPPLPGASQLAAGFFLV